MFNFMEIKCIVYIIGVVGAYVLLVQGLTMKWMAGGKWPNPPDISISYYKNYYASVEVFC